MTNRYEFGGVVMMKARIQYPTFAEIRPREPKSAVGWSLGPLKYLAWALQARHISIEWRGEKDSQVWLTRHDKTSE